MTSLSPSRLRRASTTTPFEIEAVGLTAVAEDQPTAPAAGEPVEAPKPWTRSALEWIGIVAGALMVALVIKALLIQAFVIPSLSMQPTLELNDRVLVFKPAYWLHDIGRGDVVVIDRPVQLQDGNDQSDLIKRVIGLPGDVVESRDGLVYINGEPLDEPWLPDGVRTDDVFGPITVPDGHLWLMGDNRGSSRDSRYFGPVAEDHVVGQAFLRWWPAGRFARL